MKVFVSNGVKVLAIYGDFKSKFVHIVASKNGITLTPMDKKPAGKVLGRVSQLSRPEGREPFTSIPKLTTIGKFAKSEFEATENPNGSFYINLNEPTHGFVPAKNYNTEKPKPKVKAVTDNDIQSAVTLINSLDRTVYGVVIRTTDNQLVINRITTFE